jgi:hypothetical protein
MQKRMQFIFGSTNQIHHLYGCHGVHFHGAQWKLLSAAVLALLKGTLVPLVFKHDQA